MQMDPSFFVTHTVTAIQRELRHRVKLSSISAKALGTVKTRIGFTEKALQLSSG